jgi:L-alanine-DL-glutamate epimerase-like enolase superfamily enzyme
VTGSLAFGLPPAVRTAREAAKPVRITGIDTFSIRIPTPPEELAAGKVNRYPVIKISTDAGVRGYSFSGGVRRMEERVRSLLVGKDLFAIEEHLRAGLVEFGGVEHALWDAIGKIAGQPVYRLLGGSTSWVKVYLTCVWPGKDAEARVTYQEVAEVAVRIQKAGFKGMKMRAWRPNPLDDAEACGVMRAAVGPDFALLFDRNANGSGTVWDYETARSDARALEKHNAYWLEEPFDRGDLQSPARLAREVGLTITGGEMFRGLAPFRECLVNGSFDVLQPDCGTAGGIFMVWKIAAMARAFHKPVVQHGAGGLSLGAWLQASGAIGAPWQEFGLITPPLLPEEQWSPALKILNQGPLFRFQDGHVQVPQLPGLGLDINEEALEHYRVPAGN